MSSLVLEVENISREFKNNHRTVKAVNGVSFDLREGEVLGLVGESGSGKSTIARMITQIESHDSGRIILDGEDFSHPNRKQLQRLRSKVQMVFQNADGSFNPRMKIGNAIMESIFNFHAASSRQDALECMEKYMQMVGLTPELCNRYPGEMSGGQCQRAAIVRALVAGPRVLICDEATSALDVLVQARIMELLHEIREKTNMSMLFISHDLALVNNICDRIIILRQGNCVEQGSTEKIISEPQTEYTRMLLNSIL